MRTNNSIAVARLRWVALGAAELLAAHGEYDMITRVGVSPWLAWLFPVGLGVYAFCAFATRSRTDVYAALALMVTCQSLAHLLAIGILPRHWLLVVTVSAVAPIVCWRVHHLGEHDTPPPNETQPAAATPAATSAPVAPAARRPRPALVPSIPAGHRTKAHRLTARAHNRRTPAPAAPRARQTKAETAARIAELRRQRPGITQADIAAALGYTPRWVRACSPA